MGGKFNSIFTSLLIQATGAARGNGFKGWDVNGWEGNGWDANGWEGNGWDGKGRDSASGYAPLEPDSRGAVLSFLKKLFVGNNRRMKVARNLLIFELILLRRREQPCDAAALQ